MKYSSLIIASLLIWQCAIPMQTKQATITEREIYDHIAFLASDSLEGRKPGTPQSKQAAAYILEHFKQVGLTTLGEDGYQYFDVVTSVNLGPNNSLIAAGLEAVPGENYTPLVFSANTTLDAGLVFLGYGFQIENDTMQWNDLSGQDVQDKWVMILRGNPENEASHSKYDEVSSLRHKLLLARDSGAQGVVFVSGSKFDAKDELMDLHIERNFSQAALPVIHVKRELADQLLSESGMTIDTLEAIIDGQLQPQSFAVDISLAVTTEIVQQEVTTQNVVALLPGSDPVLKEEYIIIGAHHDHLGWGGKGSGSRKPDSIAIHNGADDNASGVAAVLEIAERLALSKVPLKRSILIMTFGAEEMGILGSKFFTSNALVDLKQVKQMFNLDMVGRMNPETHSLTIGGTGTGKGIEDFLRQLAEGRDLKLSTTPDGYGPSDHSSFYIEDIPVFFFFTGITEEYHTPEDDVETINVAGEKVIADFAFDLIKEIASMEQTFEFQEAGPKSPPQGGKRGKVKMGIIPDFAAADANGFLLGGVVPGGPAAFAGMQKGDVMISLEGKSIKNVYDYMGRMADVKIGERITVEVMRGDKKLILIVQL
ncbi:M20/M25/M40 family metallo-hydrolase [bacterium]|nr:M20/M25/M40 family metallo-hydrolase [bacterium]